MLFCVHLQHRFVFFSFLKKQKLQVTASSASLYWPSTTLPKFLSVPASVCWWSSSHCTLSDAKYSSPSQTDDVITELMRWITMPTNVVSFLRNLIDQIQSADRIFCAIGSGCVAVCVYECALVCLNLWICVSKCPCLHLVISAPPFSHWQLACLHFSHPSLALRGHYSTNTRLPLNTIVCAACNNTRTTKRYESS